MEQARETSGTVPDPEVLSRGKRRRFTAEYKIRILREADRSKQSGELGALLRREGLYSSHLAAWRKERDGGALRDLAARKRGRKAARSEAERRVEQLERENARLRKRLEQAETIIAVQKKVSELLGIPLEKPSADGND